MAIDITDEGLEALDQMSPEERGQRFGALPPETQDAVIKAIPAWRQRKAAKGGGGMMTDAETGEAVKGQGAPDVNPPAAAPPTMADKVSSFMGADKPLLHGGPVDMAGDLIREVTPISSSINPLNMPGIRDQVQKGISAAQGLIRPGMEDLTQQFAAMPPTDALTGAPTHAGPATPEESASAEYQIRKFWGWFGGDDYANAMPPEKVKLAMDELDKEHDVIGAKHWITGVGMAGSSIPYLAMPETGVVEGVESKLAGWFGKTGLNPAKYKVLGGLARMGFAAAKGAEGGTAIGATSAYLTPGADIAEGAGEGAWMGTAIGGGMGAVKEVAGLGVRAVARAIPDQAGVGARMLAQEVDRFVASAKSKLFGPKTNRSQPMANVVGQLTPAGMEQLGSELHDAAGQGSIPKRELGVGGGSGPPPVLAHVVVRDGQPVAELYSLGYDKTGQLDPKAHIRDLPLDEKGSLQIAKMRLASQNGFSVTGLNADVAALSAGKSVDWWNNLSGSPSVATTKGSKMLRTPTAASEGQTVSLRKAGLPVVITPQPAEPVAVTRMPSGELHLTPTDTTYVADPMTRIDATSISDDSLGRLFQQHGVVTAEDAARAFDISPGRALEELKTAQAHGHVEGLPGGGFTLTKETARVASAIPAEPPDQNTPPPPPPASLGEDTQPIDIDDALKNGMWIPGGGAGQPAPIPPATMNDLSLLDKMRHKPGLLESMVKSFDEYFRGRGMSSPIEETRERAQQIIAARDMKRNGPIYQAAFDRLGMTKDPQVERDLFSVWNGGASDLSPLQFQIKHPDHAQLATELFPYMRQADARHAELAKAGMIPPEYADLEAYAGAKGATRYSPMIYARYLNPDKHWDMLPQNIKLDAINAIQSKWGKTTSEAHDILRSILGANDPVKALQARGDGVFQHLRAPADLPPEVRKALGPTNTLLRASEGLAIQDQLVMMKRAFDAIKADPINFSNQPKDGFVDIPNDQRMYGPIAGGYWKREIDEAFRYVRNQPDEVGKMAGILGDVARIRKANLVQGMGTLLKHVVGLSDAQAMSGGLLDVGPIDALKHLKDAVTSLKAYRLNPAEGNAAAASVWRAKTYRGLEQSWQTVETKQAASRRAVDFFEKEVGTAKGTSDIYAAAKNAVFGVANTVKELPPFVTRTVFDHLNDTVRLANFTALEQKLQAKGMTPSQASSMAGERVAMSFPSGTNVGKLTDAIRTNPALATTLPFATPLMEKIRAYSLIPQRLANEPDLAGRLVVNEMFKVGLLGLGAYGMSAASDPTQGGFMGALRAANGISNNEVDAVKKSMARSAQEFTPSAISTFVRDSRGEPIFMDPSPGTFTLEALRGNPEDAWYKRWALNLGTEPFGEEAHSMAEAGAQKLGLMRGTGGGGGGPPTPGTAGRTASDMLLGSGAVPQWAATAIRQQQSLNPTSPFQRPNTPGRALAKTAGVPIVPPAQPAQATMQDIGEYKELFRQAHGVMRELSPTEQGSMRDLLFDKRRTTAEKKAVIEKIVEQIKAGPASRIQQRGSALQQAGNPAYLRSR